ncbi:anoctamin-10 isoform X2 [Synchiropus splendidus]|uniref:anoctamin-10 isoform X2 n=1 Tax=Synchiropus splendidus TaxID=270530 RepID=UPI00237E20CD|nr:anoctamin-10 isoform X2 [Synchiropus splendidus]
MSAVIIRTSDFTRSCWSLCPCGDLSWPSPFPQPLPRKHMAQMNQDFEPCLNHLDPAVTGIREESAVVRTNTPAGGSEDPDSGCTMSQAAGDAEKFSGEAESLGSLGGPGWTKVSCPCCMSERVEPLVLLRLGEKVRPETKRWIMRLIGTPQKDGGAALLAHPGEDAGGDIIVVAAPRCTLLRAAEELGLCRTTRSGDMEAFSYHDRERFRDSDNMASFLTLAERQHVVRYELEGLRAQRDLRVPGLPENCTLQNRDNIWQKLQSAGVVLDTFPLHDQKKLRELREAWYSGNQLVQPLDSVNEYFGSTVAFYFSFLDFYTLSLLPPALLGLTITYFSGEVQKEMTESMSGSPADSHEDDSGLAVSGHMVQAAFSMLWSTVVMELWKRRSASLSYRWGTFHLAERFAEPRPSFHGDLGVNPVTGRVEPLFSEWQRDLRMALVSVPVVGLFLGMEHGILLCQWVSPAWSANLTLAREALTVACATTVSSTVTSENGTHNFENDTCHSESGTCHSESGTCHSESGTCHSESGTCHSENDTCHSPSFKPLPPLLSGLVVFGMMCFYWGEAQVQQLHQDWDSMLSQTLLYMPSVLHIVYTNMLATVYKIVAQSLTEFENHREESAFQNHLTGKVLVFTFFNYFAVLFHIAFFKQDVPLLRKRLASLLVITQLVNQVTEVVIPFLVDRFLSAPHRTEREDDPEEDKFRNQISLPVFPGLFAEYIELLVQFGYLSLFSCVYPLTAVLLLINNLTEIRSDAYKICNLFRKPFSPPAANMGVWQVAFEAACRDSGLSGAQVLLLAVGVEHLLIIVKGILAVLIPDEPGWMKKKQDQLEFKSMEALRQQKLTET